MKQEELSNHCQNALKHKIERDKHQARFFALSDAIKDIRSGSEYFDTVDCKQERIFKLYEEIIELNEKVMTTPLTHHERIDAYGELSSLKIEKSKLVDELNQLKSEYREADQFKLKIENRMYMHNEDMMNSHHYFRTESKTIIAACAKSKALKKWYDASPYSMYLELDAS